MLFTVDVKEGGFNMSFLKPNPQRKIELNDFKSTKLSINLDQINMVEKIELHRHTSEMNFRDLYKLILMWKGYSLQLRNWKCS